MDEASKKREGEGVGKKCESALVPKQVRCVLMTLLHVCDRLNHMRQDTSF